MFAEALSAILADQCTPATVRAIENGASAQPLALAIAEAGFHDLLAPEDRGGGAVGWCEFHDVVALCGEHAVPLPLVQTMAARALISGMEPLPEGLIAWAPSLVRSADGSLVAQQVPFARTADHVIAASGDALVLLPASAARQVPSGVHGSLTASLRWNGGAARVLDAAVPAGELQGLAALLHAGLLAGAMQRVFDMTMAYANERVQFGKPLGKFQAIQHQLSVMAEQVAAASMAAEAAFSVDAPRPTPTACAVAKARTSEAAQLVASIAHAVHGAIGVTEEYDLQLYTRRLHEWRMVHGSEAHWHRVLGRLVIESREPSVVDTVRSLC